MKTNTKYKISFRRLCKAILLYRESLSQTVALCLVHLLFCDFVANLCVPLFLRLTMAPQTTVLHTAARDNNVSKIRSVLYVSSLVWMRKQSGRRGGRELSTGFVETNLHSKMPSLFPTICFSLPFLRSFLGFVSCSAVESNTSFVFWLALLLY